MSAYQFLLVMVNIICLSVLVSYLAAKSGSPDTKPNIRVLDEVEEKPIVDGTMPEGQAEEASAWSDMLRFPPPPGDTTLRLAQSPKNLAAEKRAVECKSCPGSNSTASWGDRAREDFNRTMHGG